jgi:hypothetical protein
MIIHIRGNLGAQTTSLLAGIAIAKEKGQKIQEVIHNTHNYPDILYKLEPNSINKTFIKYTTNYKGNIKSIPGTGKTDAFNLENAKLIVKYRDELIEELAINRELKERSIIHIRDNDRPLATEEKYKSIIEPQSIVMGDNLEYIKSFNARIVHIDALRDWFYIYESLNCSGAFSAFTFSIALLNKDFKLNIFDKNSCQFHKNLHNRNWESINYYIQNCENINWITS